MTAATWLLVAGPSARDALAPLLETHRAQRPVRTLDTLPEPAALDDVAAVMVVGNPRRSPRNSLPGLFLRDHTGRRVPVGWMPEVATRLPVFAAAAAAVVARAHGLARGPVVLLGQWEDRSLRLAELTEKAFADATPSLPIFRWTAERLVRSDMLQALGCGPGLAIYFGHGRGRGWAGYHGVRAQHLAAASGEPVGAMLSITCHTANRQRIGLSFCEQLTLSGICAAATGATGRTLHLENGLLANNLCSAFGTVEPPTLGELLLAGIPDRSEKSIYRIIGDPLAPLIGSACAPAGCAAVFAPAADAPLPPLDLCSIH